MTEAAWRPPAPDVSQLVMEDDTPVESFPVEKNQRLLVSALYSSWDGPPRRVGPPGREELVVMVKEDRVRQDRPSFLAAARVALFNTPKNPPLVPAVLVSAHVTLEELSWTGDGHRAYLGWEMATPPDLVIEIVATADAGELGPKRERYETMGVSFYLVFDPGRRLGQEPILAFDSWGLSLERLRLVKGRAWFEALGLGLGCWEGVFEGTRGTWLRFFDRYGEPLLTGDERAARERQWADGERERAARERERAEREHERAERLEAQLRALGADPE